MPQPQRHRSVDPLGEAAWRWAVARYGSEAALDAPRMTLALETVRRAINARLSRAYAVDDVGEHAVLPSGPGAAVFPSISAGRYGVVLAAFGRAARSSAPDAPMMALAEQLAADLEDDDGGNDSADVRPSAYGPSAGARWGAEIAAIRASCAATGLRDPDPALHLCPNRDLYRTGARWSLEPMRDEVDGGDSDGRKDRVNAEFEVIGRLPFGGARPLAVVRRDVYEYCRIYAYGSSSVQIEYVPPKASRRYMLPVGGSELLSNEVVQTQFFDDGSAPDVRRRAQTETTKLWAISDTTSYSRTHRNTCRFFTEAKSGERPVETLTVRSDVMSTGHGIDFDCSEGRKYFYPDDDELGFESGPFFREVVRSGKVDGLPVPTGDVPGP